MRSTPFISQGTHRWLESYRRFLGLGFVKLAYLATSNIQTNTQGLTTFCMSCNSQDGWIMDRCGNGEEAVYKKKKESRFGKKL